MTADLPLWYHSPFTLSITVITQMDTGATSSAMSYTGVLNILQLGEVQLDPPEGKIYKTI